VTKGGFNINNFVNITIDYNPLALSYSYSITDGVKTETGTINYNPSNGTPGSGFVIWTPGTTPGAQIDTFKVLTKAPLAADTNRDGTADVQDLIGLAQNWLKFDDQLLWP